MSSGKDFPVGKAAFWGAVIAALIAGCCGLLAATPNVLSLIIQLGNGATPTRISIAENSLTPTIKPTMSVALMTPTSSRVPTSTPIRAYTPSPTSSPTATFTPLPPTSPTGTRPGGLTLLLKDDFNDGVLNSSLWDVACEQGTAKVVCAQGVWKEANGQLQFHLPVNQTSPWENSYLTAKIQAPQNVRWVVAHILLKNSVDDMGWIGMFTSCGRDYINLAASQSKIAFEKNLERTTVESGFPLPVTRTLITEWEGGQARLMVPESNLQKSVKCDYPLVAPSFGVVTNPNGFVDGSIDDVEIWGVSPG